jgi:hypothetical protein
MKTISSGAMVSISDFDSGDVGSNPSLITKIFLSSNGLGFQAFYLKMRVRISWGIQNVGSSL